MAAVTKQAAQVKKLAQPGQQSAAKELSVMKQAAARQRQAALKAAMPARSALVRQRTLAGQQLGGAKSALTKGIGEVKKSGQLTKAASMAKQADAGGKTRQAIRLGRILRRYS
jgi:hypothetical protein